MIPELMSCRSPSPLYAMFLKEQFLSFQMTCIVQNKTLTLDDPQDFFYAFHNSLAIVKKFLCELFLYNLVEPDCRDWNPLLYVGDIQLQALMSWIQNEISREHQAQQYIEMEYEIPLFLRPKAKNS